MNTHHKIGWGILALAIALLLAVTGCSDGKKEKLMFADCPIVVQKAFDNHAGALPFSEIKRETKKDGRVIYEAKAKKADGKEVKIKVAADGALIKFEIEDKD